MKTDFHEFKTGDVVSVLKDHPHLHPMLLVREEWTVSIMISDAGVVCLEEVGNKKTFPVEWFVRKSCPIDQKNG